MTALVERVRRRLVDEGVTRVPDSARVAAALRDEGLLLGDEALLSLVGSLRDELGGLGPLQSLLLDPAVTDVLVNGPDEVWIDRGDGLELADVRFDGSASVLRLAQRLATMAGRRLDEAAPFVDARLADGTRLHAVIPPIAASCSLISLRIPVTVASGWMTWLLQARSTSMGLNGCAPSCPPDWRSSSVVAPAQARRHCCRPFSRWSILSIAS